MVNRAIQIGEKIISIHRIASVDLDHRFYANGSSTWLVLELINPKETIRREHGFGFDVYTTHQNIKDMLGVV